MTYSLFGAKTTLATFTSVEAQYSVMPVLVAPSTTLVAAHLEAVLDNVKGVSLIVDEVAAAAEVRPLPPAQTTLQDTIAAARTRLARLRSRTDRDKHNAALGHVTQLRALVGP
jgi:hypothetical protein